MFNSIDNYMVESPKRFERLFKTKIPRKVTLNNQFMHENYYTKHFFPFYPHYVIIPPLNKTTPLLSARLL